MDTEILKKLALTDEEIRKAIGNSYHVWVQMQLVAEAQLTKLQQPFELNGKKLRLAVVEIKTGWCPQHGYPEPCDKCGLEEYQPTKQEE